MGFVNEYVPEEDIKNYNLDDIWLKYHPAYQSVPSYFRHYWTIDREDNICLMLMDIGREEISNRHTFVVYWKGELIEVKLDLAPSPESSGNLNDRPFLRAWKLVSVRPSTARTVTIEQVMEILKKSLTVYGYDGVRRQVPDTIVKFKL